MKLSRRVMTALSLRHVMKSVSVDLIESADRHRPPSPILLTAEHNRMKSNRRITRKLTVNGIRIMRKLSLPSRNKTKSE